MKHWSEWDGSTLKFNSNKTRDGIEYLNVASGFDIESSSVVVDGEKNAFMYLWTFGIGYGEERVYGRTWDELMAFYNIVVDTLELNERRRLVVYIHNFSYEFQFMRNYFNWSSSFSTSVRKPMKAHTMEGVEFRDSYILSGYSLEDTALNLTKHSIEKLGEFNYAKIRHHLSKLSESEMKYADRDVEIVVSYIHEQLEMYGSIKNMPLTNTSRVRKFVRNNVYYTTKSHKSTNRSKYFKYRELMDKLQLTVKEYYLLKQAFQGGFVHSNPLWTNEKMENVTGYDFISSYSGVMVTEKFPMSSGQLVQVKSLKHLNELMDNYCVLMRANFVGLESIIDYEHYLSESKCENIVNVKTANGRIISADNIETTITEVDYRIMEKVYKWKGVKFAEVYIYERGYLPKPIIESIISLYGDKTQLKGVDGMESQYTHSKGMLNSTFGMMVTDIVREKISYENDWKSTLPLVNEEIRGYNSSKGRFLFYPWGVWTTSYARRNLWSGILTFKRDYLYSDTDGIKVMNADKYEGYIKGYNLLNERKINNMCSFYKIDPSLLSPKTINGVTKTVGNWDFDGQFDYFKSLGAKRYLASYGQELLLTVAGVGKKSATDYMLKECNGSIDKVFDMFDNNLVIPKEYSGNLTHTYIDSESTIDVVDEDGVKATVTSKSGIHLEEVEFSLSLTDSYLYHIEQLQQGYLFEGVDKFNV